jgi:S1-C subfamily serine protease
MQEPGTPQFPQEPQTPQEPQHAEYPPQPQYQYPVTPASPTTPRLDGGTVPSLPTSQTVVEQPPAAPTYAGAPWPPYAPYGGGMPPFSQAPKPRRRRWAFVLLALAQLAVLAIGIVAGAVAFSRTSAANTITVGAQSAPAITQSSSVSTLQQTVENVAAAVSPSVVKITSVGGRQEAIGSGNIVTADGYIVTNDHVVQGFDSFTVTLSNGKNYPARVVGQDPQDDLAVLKISATGLKPIAFGDSSKATVGEFAIAIGYPLGLKQTSTFGIVSGLNRTASETPSGPAGTLTGLVQTSAPINPGNSGGALVNLQGQLIGIPTLSETDPQNGSSANGIGYAIPSNRVLYVVTQLIDHGQVTNTGQGFLGIQAQDVTPSVASANGLSVQQGVLVTGFANDATGKSPAQQAGLRTGDVIVAVNGQAVSDNGDLASALLSRSPGTKVTVTVVRGSSQATISVTLGQRPSNSQG